jgi:hypothetical protein
MAEKHDNTTQDPKHPANITPAREHKTLEPGVVPTGAFTSENMRTVQEVDATGKSLGVGPISPAEPFAEEPAETVEELGIGPRTPYPTGNPPPLYSEAILQQSMRDTNVHHDKHLTPTTRKNP